MLHEILRPTIGSFLCFMAVPARNPWAGLGSVGHNIHLVGNRQLFVSWAGCIRSLYIGVKCLSVQNDSPYFCTGTQRKWSIMVIAVDTVRIPNLDEDTKQEYANLHRPLVRPPVTPFAATAECRFRTGAPKQSKLLMPSSFVSWYSSVCTINSIPPVKNKNNLFL